MEKSDLKIIYMGTPDFAVGPLKGLIENHYNVIAVVTMPDKPAGRGHKIQFSPVKQFALENQLPLLQPDKLKDPDFINQLQSLYADLQIVVAFRMLPEVVWSMPRFGTFNLHASLLPQYRGAAPINWAIINGETETGITTFFLEKGMDTGKIIQQKHVPISDTDNMEIVHDKLMQLGSKLVLDTVEAILLDKIIPIDQASLPETKGELKPAPKIFKETCLINWNQSVKQIYDFIRGLSPYPAARTTLVNAKNEEVEIKIFETTKEMRSVNCAPGTVETDGKTYIKIAACDGYIQIISLQQSGKKRLNVEDFLRGFKVK